MQPIQAQIKGSGRSGTDLREEDHLEYQLQTDGPAKTPKNMKTTANIKKLKHKPKKEQPANPKISN